MSCAETVLLAAHGLSQPFSEWDLTIAAWDRDHTTFSMRGYPDYPDHKRVYMEVTGTKLLGRGLIERVRPNHYQLTSLGHSTVVFLTVPTFGSLYLWTKSVLKSQGYTEWSMDPSRPTVKPFWYPYIDCHSDIALCAHHKVEWIVGNGRPIHVRELANIQDYIQAMRSRFERKDQTPERQEAAGQVRGQSVQSRA